MGVSLDAFRQAAQIGGRITLDQRQPGGLEASEGRLGSRVVAWVKDHAPSEGVKAENRAATQALIDAIRAEHGDLLGDLALARLAGDLTRGLPLTERTVTMILGATGRAAKELAQMNDTTAMRFARVDDPGRAGSFGSVLKEVSTALGTPRTAGDLDPGRLAKVRQAIESEIRDAGAQGPLQNARIIDDAEAHAIATRHIKELLVAEGRDALLRELATPGDGSGYLDHALAMGLSRRGIPLGSGELALGGLVRGITDDLMQASRNPNEGRHTRPVERGAAQTLVQDRVDRFLDTLEETLEKAAELAQGDPEHEALLRRAAIGGEGMTPEALERLWASRGEVALTLLALADPHLLLEDRVAALATLAGTLDQALGDLGLEGEAGRRFAEALLRVGGETAGLGEKERAALGRALATPELTALHETLGLPGGDPGLKDELGEAGELMLGMAAILGSLREEAGIKAGSGGQKPIGSLAEAPPSVLRALRSVGIEIEAS